MVSVTIRAIIPKKSFASKKWLESIASAQRRLSVPQLRSLFQKTVFGWSKKPDFGWVQTKTSDEIGIQMYAQGEGADVYALLDAGSPPHIISPKRGGLLRFRPGYRSATKPGVIQSQRAYRSGKHISVNRVDHPGFPARKFGALVNEAFVSDFAMQMQEAITEAANG